MCSRRSPRWRNRIARWPKRSTPSSRPTRPTSCRERRTEYRRTPRTAASCAFFRPAPKFSERYATFGFNDNAKLDDGNMWPVAYALKQLTKADEAKITALIKQAVSWSGRGRAQAEPAPGRLSEPPLNGCSEPLLVAAAVAVPRRDVGARDDSSVRRGGVQAQGGVGDVVERLGGRGMRGGCQGRRGHRRRTEGCRCSDLLFMFTPASSSCSGSKGDSPWNLSGCRRSSHPKVPAAAEVALKPRRAEGVDIGYRRVTSRTSGTWVRCTGPWAGWNVTGWPNPTAPGKTAAEAVPDHAPR